MYSGSKRFTFDGTDFKKLGISFALGLCGFVSAWFAKEAIPVLETDGGTLALLIAAGVPILVNGVRKLFQNNRAPL